MIFRGGEWDGEGSGKKEVRVGRSEGGKIMDLASTTYNTYGFYQWGRICLSFMEWGFLVYEMR